jgi:hypothetical protein
LIREAIATYDPLISGQRQSIIKFKFEQDPKKEDVILNQNAVD